MAEETLHRIRWSLAASQAGLWLMAELARSGLLLCSRERGHPTACRGHAVPGTAEGGRDPANGSQGAAISHNTL